MKATRIARPLFCLLLAVLFCAQSFIFASDTLLTNLNDENYVRLTISGNKLTAVGKILCDGLDTICLQCGEANAWENTSSGQDFSASLTLNHDGIEPVILYLFRTGESKGKSFFPLAFYIQKTIGGYVMLESSVLEENNIIESAFIDLDYIMQTPVPDTVKEASAEIVGAETDDYEKLFLLHRWVAENIYYDYDYAYGREKTTPLSSEEVLRERRSTCEGYVNLLVDLIRAQGIPAIFCANYALSGTSYSVSDISAAGGHAHAEAFLDGRWVILDPTWDSRNEYEYGKFNEIKPVGFYYFDITPEAFAMDHRVFQRAYVEMLDPADEGGFCVKNGELKSYIVSDDIVIPEGVSVIDPVFFCLREKVTSLAYPSTLTRDASFFFCDTLEAVYLPAETEYLYYACGYACPALTDIFFAGSEEQWKTVIAATDSNLYYIDYAELNILRDPAIRVHFNCETRRESFVYEGKPYIAATTLSDDGITLRCGMEDSSFFAAFYDESGAYLGGVSGKEGETVALPEKLRSYASYDIRLHHGKSRSESFVYDGQPGTAVATLSSGSVTLSCGVKDSSFFAAFYDESGRFMGTVSGADGETAAIPESLRSYATCKVMSCADGYSPFCSSILFE